jgi:uncharacterized repeat protein (TIGR03943 family)
MSRPVQAFVLVMLGAALIRLGATGAADNYVRPGLRPYLVAAGLLFAVLGIVGVLRDLRGGEVERAAAESHAQARIRTHGPGARPPEPHDHEHDQHGWYSHGIGWLLCLPLLLLLVSPPPALGSYAAGRTDAKVPRPVGSTSYPPLPASDPAPLAIRDYAVRAVWDHGRTLTGRRVILTGFVAPSVSAGNSWYLARLHIICCAADAQTAKVAVVGSPTQFPAGQWISVTGTWLASDPHDLDGQVARIQAAQVRIVDQPAQPYE